MTSIGRIWFILTYCHSYWQNMKAFKSVLPFCSALPIQYTRYYCRLLDVPPTGRLKDIFSDRTFLDVFNALIRQGLASKQCDVELSAWTVLPLSLTTRVAIWNSGKDRSSRCWSRRIPFELHLCRCVHAYVCVCLCVWATFTITGWGWVVNRNNNFDHAETAQIKSNGQTSYHTGICLNLCQLQCICWKSEILLIQYHLHRFICQGKILLGKRLVGKTSG